MAITESDLMEIDDVDLRRKLVKHLNEPGTSVHTTINKGSWIIKEPADDDIKCIAEAIPLGG